MGLSNFALSVYADQYHYIMVHVASVMKNTPTTEALELHRDFAVTWAVTSKSIEISYYFSFPGLVLNIMYETLQHGEIHELETETHRRAFCHY